MAREAEHFLGTIAAIVDGLRALGLTPVLVGGMALVVLGSRRVTRDFDFLVASPGDRLAEMLALFYDRGLELASRVNAAVEVTSTISNRKVAAVRLRLDAPASASFYDAATDLRVDLLFDYPVRAADVARRATTTKVRSHVLDIASEADLLHLKLIAQAARSAPGDAEDIAFLQMRRKTTTD